MWSTRQKVIKYIYLGAVLHFLLYFQLREMWCLLPHCVSLTAPSRGPSEVLVPQPEPQNTSFTFCFDKETFPP